VGGLWLGWGFVCFGVGRGVKDFLLALLLVFPIGAKADPAHCKALANASPDGIMDLTRTPTDILEVDNPGLGYNVNYIRPGVLFSVYFFDGGHDELDEGHEVGYLESAVKDMDAWAQSEEFTFDTFYALDMRKKGEFVSFFVDTTD